MGTVGSDAIKAANELVEIHEKTSTTTMTLKEAVVKVSGTKYGDDHLSHLIDLCKRVADGVDQKYIKELRPEAHAALTHVSQVLLTITTGPLTDAAQEANNLVQQVLTKTPETPSQPRGAIHNLLSTIRKLTPTLAHKELDLVESNIKSIQRILGKLSNNVTQFVKKTFPSIGTEATEKLEIELEDLSTSVAPNFQEFKERLNDTLNKTPNLFTETDVQEIVQNLEKFIHSQEAQRKRFTQLLTEIKKKLHGLGNSISEGAKLLVRTINERLKSESELRPFL